MRIPLLLTSAVNVSAPFVEIRDVDRRVALTLDAICEWIRIEPNIEIVICDGSGYDFHPLINRTLPNANIECLYFQNNQEKVRTRGKGFGEGEIVNHAVFHSKLICATGCFAKCTSKLWVENFSKCLTGFNGTFSCEKTFTGRSIYNYTQCDTRFYITEKNFYLNNLASCHTLVEDLQGFHLEHAFAGAIRGKNIRHVTFKIKPLIYGFSGTTGEYWFSPPENFKGTLLRRIRHLFG